MLVLDVFVCCYRFVYNRYLRLFWPNNTALFDSKCTTTMSAASVVDRSTKGFVVVEVPLATRHTANIDYVYNVSDNLPLAVLPRRGLLLREKPLAKEQYFTFSNFFGSVLSKLLHTCILRRSSVRARGRRWSNITERKSWKASIIACRSHEPDSIRTPFMWSWKTSGSPSVPTTFTGSNIAHRGMAPTSRRW